MSENKRYENAYKVQAVKLAKKIGAVKAANELQISRKRCFSMVKSLQKSRIIQLSAGIVLELFRIKEYNINIAQVYSICKLKMNILYKSRQKSTGGKYYEKQQPTVA